MSATITMNVTEARRRLGNTRALSSEQVDEAQRVVSAFYAVRPRRQCPACQSRRWAEHESAADGQPIWACAGCHRSATLTQADWNTQQAACRKAADEHLRATEAATPPPRVVLRERLTALEASRAELAKIEAAVPAARATVSAAQLRHDRASEAAETVSASAAEAVAAAIFTGSKPTPAVSPAAARAELSAAVDGLVAAKNATVIINGKVESARSSVGYASDRARRAARGVIAAEMLETLLADATESQAAYLESVGRIGWLLRNHSIPDGDARPR